MQTHIVNQLKNYTQTLPKIIRTNITYLHNQLCAYTQANRPTYKIVSKFIYPTTPNSTILYIETVFKDRIGNQLEIRTFPNETSTTLTMPDKNGKRKNQMEKTFKNK